MNTVAPEEISKINKINNNAINKIYKNNDLLFLIKISVKNNPKLNKINGSFICFTNEKFTKEKQVLL